MLTIQYKLLNSCSHWTKNWFQHLLLSMKYKLLISNSYPWSINCPTTVVNGVQTAQQLLSMEYKLHSNCFQWRIKCSGCCQWSTNCSTTVVNEIQTAQQLLMMEYKLLSNLFQWNTNGFTQLLMMEYKLLSNCFQWSIPAQTVGNEVLTAQQLFSMKYKLLNSCSH